MIQRKGTIATTVFSIYILVSFYVFGGGMINALVAYPTWRWVGSNEFVKFHQTDSKLIIPFFVIIFFLSFIPQVLLFWFRPASIKKKWVVLALIFNLVVLLSTIIIQIPIQVQLNTGFSMTLIDRLIATDMIFRRIPMVMLATTNFIMLYKLVKDSAAGNEFIQK